MITETRNNTAAMARMLALQSQRCRRMILRLPQADCPEISHHEALEEPAAAAAQLANFFGLDAAAIEAMSNAVAPSMRRVKLHSACSIASE